MKKLKQINLKEEKAITLIALIITLIVLIILAGVAISTLAGENGIINRSVTSKQRTEVAGVEEELQIAIEALKIDWHQAGAYGTVGEYLAGHVEDLKTAVGDNTLTLSGNKITYSGHEFTINDQTGKITGSTVVTPGATKSWSTTIEEGKTVITDGEVKLHIGDYVQYDPSSGATKTSETSYYSQNGVQDEIFSLSKLATTGIGWRVLGLDEETKQIMLVSDSVIKDDRGDTYFCFCEPDGFKNGISELNKICSLYGQGLHATSARSITVDDVNRLTGFKPTNPRFGVGGWNEYENEVTYTREVYGDISSSASNGKSWSGDSPVFNYFNGTDFVPLDSGSKKLTSTYYSYNGISEISVLGSNLYYWLATPFIRTYSDHVTYGFFGVFNDSIWPYEFVDSSSDSYYIADGYDIRPVVYLEASVGLEPSSSPGTWRFVQ